MSENQDFVVNPNETPLIPHDKIEKAYIELTQLLETIELIVFNAHAIYKPHKDRELIVNSETFEMIFELTYDIIESKVPSNIRQLIDEYSDFRAFVRKVLEIYAENVKRFNQFLAQPNYTPITGANNFVTRHKLFNGIDIANTIYEYQMLYTTVQYAYMIVIEEISRSSIPAFQFIRNKYSVFIGMLVDILPLLIQTKRTIEENIRSTGSYTTMQEILKLLYGVHLELLKGWLVKMPTRTNLFFIDYSVNDSQEVLKAYNDFLRGLRRDYSSNAILFTESKTKDIITSDSLWKTNIDLLRHNIYRTPYVLADIKSIDELTQQIINYLEAYALLFYLLYKTGDIEAASQKLSTLIEELHTIFTDDSKVYTQLITSIFNYTEEDLTVWYDYVQVPVRVTLFGESYDLSIIELIILSLIVLNSLLSDSLQYADEQITVNSSLIENLFMTITTNAEYIYTRTNIFREQRNKKVKEMLEFAQKEVRQIVNSLLFIANEINANFYRNLETFFETFRNASLDARIRETIKLFTTTLLFVMPFIDPNFVVLPLTNTLYSYIGANILPLVSIVSDLLLRTFELPYRLIRAGLTESIRTITDFTNYLTFEDNIRLILATVDVGFSSLFGRICLYYCFTQTTNRNDKVTNILADVFLSKEYVLGDTLYIDLPILQNIGILSNPFCLCQNNHIKNLLCLQYKSENDFYKISMPVNIADVTDFINELRLRFGRLCY